MPCDAPVRRGVAVPGPGPAFAFKGLRLPGRLEVLDILVGGDAPGGHMALERIQHAVDHRNVPGGQVVQRLAVVADRPGGWTRHGQK